jgi:hypothetical protein
MRNIYTTIITISLLSAFSGRAEKTAEKYLKNQGQESIIYFQTDSSEDWSFRSEDTINLPYSQTFTEYGMPVGWTEQLEGENVISNWEQVNTSAAGGNSGEMRSHWQQCNPAVTRLVMPPFNTLGAAKLNLTFKHFLDAYGSGAMLQIQSSADGITWTDESWQVLTCPTNIDPELVSTSIDSNLNQPATYIAFTVSGNLFKYDFWHIDDVILNVSQTQYNNITTSAVPSFGGVSSGDGIYSIGETVTVSALANQGFTFTSWTENDTIVSQSADYTFLFENERILIANFEPIRFMINLTYNPAGAGLVYGAGWYNCGSLATVEAVPAEGFYFSSWKESGEVVSNSAEYTFTVSGNRLITAEFIANPCYLYTVSYPTEGGVTAGEGIYACGSTATLSATPSYGWYFLSWTDEQRVVSSNPVYSFTLEGEKTLVANFTREPQQFTISASPNPAVGGLTTGSGIYTQGQNVTLMAESNEGYTFVEWLENGNFVSDSQQISFSAAANRDLTARFKSTVGITESFNENLKLYPNPTNGLFVVESDHTTGTISEVLIIGLTGKTVVHIRNINPAEKMTVDAGKLPESVYLLKIIFKNGNTSTKKLVIKK